MRKKHETVEDVILAIKNQTPHTVREGNGAWERVYWRGNAASGYKGADRVELRIFVCGNGYVTLRTYALPSAEHECERDCRALRLVFDAGKAERSKQFRKLLDGREDL